ncbi:hypothetical protein ACIQCQ_36870 [Streptomyces sp. NPDC088394]|uniref:hypothetical protein n=1 Tax=Streptomyces sp. NPDC088394 TaxID=3365860 RepID=UPI00381E306C
MSLFWEEMVIDPPHSPERCPRGRNDHFATCYGEMLTPEVRSTLVCTLEPGHEDAHAAEIGISDEGLCVIRTWGCPGGPESQVPGKSINRAPATGLQEREVSPCLLFERHPGMHLGQGIGLVDDEGLNRRGERSYDDTSSERRL